MNESLDEYKQMFEALTSAGTIEKLPSSEEVHANIAPLSYGMEGYVKKCCQRYCESAYKNIEQLREVSTLYVDHLPFKKEVL